MKWKRFFCALFAFLVAVSIALAVFPVNAQLKKKTYPFIDAVPNPVGVNQETLLTVGITEPLLSSEDGWTGLWVEIIKPDNTTETIQNIRTDSTGATGVKYVPKMEGTYRLRLHFPAQWYNKTYIDFWGRLVTYSCFYEASVTDWYELVVQSEPVPPYPGFSLPFEYWSRPIDAQLREWYTIAGSWLYTPENRFAPYNDYAPETPHILWTKTLTMGGLVGGDVGLETSINQGPVGFGIGDAYEGKWYSRFIVAGRLIYAERAGGFGITVTPTPVVYHCVDLHTGEELWAKTFLDNQTISFAQLLYWQTMNYQGAFAYLYVVKGGATFFGPPTPEEWYAFDVYTGDWRFTIKNVPSGITLCDSNGWLYRLQVDLINGRMTLWSMNALCTFGPEFMAASWGNSVTNKVFDAAAPTPAAKAAWTLNVTIPKGLPGTVQYPSTWNVVNRFPDRIIGSNLGGAFFAGPAPAKVVVWGISLKKGQEGTLLFNESWPAPSEWLEGNQTISWAAWSLEDKVGVLWAKETRTHYGVSLETGKLMWGPTPSQAFQDMWEGTQLTSHLIAYHRLYACGVAGVVYCYNVANGNLLWTYKAEDPYHEYLFANNWWLGIPFITDGKVYLVHGEHSPNQPLPRGAPFICLNATTGEEIFRVDGLRLGTGWGGLPIIGDSTIVGMDTYDLRVYAIGKGPSATTVSAKVAVGGTSVVIEGMVLDVSPGIRDSAIQMRFPNGVPAVDDECMGDWMLYVYKQFPRPANIKGVWVKLDAINVYTGEVLDIGGTFTDSAGMFTVMWTPPKEGLWTILATFPGSKSYYSSFAETSIGVTGAPAAPAALTTTDIAIIVAVIIAIIIGIANLYIILKKK